jgi:circadian clock protein KaiC
MYVLKSRGMAHSNQIREFLIGDNGVSLIPVYIGPNGVLTGSARAAQEVAERAVELGLAQESGELAAALELRREAVEQHVAALRADFDAEENLTGRLIQTSKAREDALLLGRQQQGRERTVKPETGP